MAELKHFDSTVDVKTITDTLEKDGALILDNVVSADFLAELRAETDPYMEATSNGADDFGGRLTTRTGGLVMRSEKCRALVMDERILEPCNAFLGPYCEKVQLHLTQIIRIRGGQTAQPIHRDRWAWGTHLAHVEPQFNTIWAITDFTAENGATQVVPGSTKWPDNAEIKPEQITQAEMKAGSVLIYSGSVFHGGGENRSSSDRIGINITYTLGWLRQEENQYLTCPPELAKTLPRDLQALVGYSMGQYALGYFTPPGAPGEAPEVVPPEYALGIESDGSSLGDYDALEVVQNAVKSN
ncbi:phytanoyl-CoA dioxygenase family protein [Alphaproteobacteria bacterium]|nr:phytanoyl-CoA dioxygenase family protein [Alphaproteobacteria bacterium]MDA8666838.1 phytanoyl-CoA dioxygenase family protein [Alphaproteobacteria bacterium]MDA8725416.1 phytanoyl-CoA dioxygenase family protein [Alphaproteobacteria bacterium]MDA8779762.1 phytanoyl-CoA dioxygenase family protein [Alphaproteobacteria bacterium]MDA9590431.1 phytanoyl-CoA dioxygenase family protein [Alphaproteobacteria bacterium]